MLAHFDDQGLFIRAFEKSPIGSALLSAEGRVLKANPSLCQLFGYSENELIQLGVSCSTHPEDEEADRLWHRLVQGEMDSYRVEKRFAHQAGTILWGLLHVTVERNHQGIQGNDIYISQIVDITEQKKKEEAFKRIEELHTLIAEHSQDVILRLTPEGMISYCSPAIRNQLGYEPEELIGKYAYEYWHPEDMNGAG